MDFKLFYFSLAVLCVQSTFSATSKKPNIIVIVADDLGWDDVSYHGSNQILTPNIDSMASHGVVLHNYYTDIEGTPSSSAFFTGKYPMRFGGQGPSIAASEDRGIPVSELFLPCYLKELGYATHLVGKWPLGKSRIQYWPTNRGFDSFYGFTDSSSDYYTFNYVETWSGNEFFGLNLYHNLEPMEDQTGYLTDILSDRAIQLIREHNTSMPLYLHLAHAAPHAGGGLVHIQTPPENNMPNEHIEYSPRRLYAGMVTSLDKTVGFMVAALAERGMLNNTLIVFMSDNGAVPKGSSQNFGLNLPFRGTKGTPWEGAVRSPAIIWHSSLSSTINHELFHVTDWTPTLVAAAGGTISHEIDGVNQWDVITKNQKTKRKAVLITLDDLNGIIAYREGDYKIILGEIDEENSYYHGTTWKGSKPLSAKYEDYLLEAETSRVLKETLGFSLNVNSTLAKRSRCTIPMHKNKIQIGDLCIPKKAKGCLYNLTADPTETRDLWQNSSEIVTRLTLHLRSLWAKMEPRTQRQFDARSDPSLRNHIWGSWLDESEKLQEPPKEKPTFPAPISARELQSMVEVSLKSLSENLQMYMKTMSETFMKTVDRLF